MTTTHENKGQSTSDIVLVILKNYNDARNNECKIHQTTVWQMYEQCSSASFLFLLRDSHLRSIPCSENHQQTENTLLGNIPKVYQRYFVQCKIGICLNFRRHRNVMPAIVVIEGSTRVKNSITVISQATLCSFQRKIICSIVLN